MTALDVASVNEQPDVFATLQLMSPLTTHSTGDFEVIVQMIISAYICIFSKMLKDIGIEVPNSTETRSSIHANAGEDR